MNLMNALWERTGRLLEVERKNREGIKKTEKVFKE